MHSIQHLPNSPTSDRRRPLACHPHHRCSENAQPFSVGFDGFPNPNPKNIAPWKLTCPLKIGSLVGLDEIFQISHPNAFFSGDLPSFLGSIFFQFFVPAQFKKAWTWTTTTKRSIKTSVDFGMILLHQRQYCFVWYEGDRFWAKGMKYCLP